MLLFPMLPAPLAMLLIIPIVCVGAYHFIYVKLNKFEANKPQRLERQIIKITNIVLIYLIVMAIFRNDTTYSRMWIGFIGGNIMMALLYMCIIPAYLIFKGKYNDNDLKEGQESDDANILKARINRKKGLYFLIAVIVSNRFIIVPFLSYSSSIVIRILITFILICIMQYYYNQDLIILGGKPVNNATNLSTRRRVQKNLLLGLALVMILAFTDGVVFQPEQEKETMQWHP